MSLYKRLHESQTARTTAKRDPLLDELRQKIHQSLIDELGPVLYDKRLSPDELHRKVQEHLHTALGLEKRPLSASDRAQLLQDISDDVLGYGPIDKFLKDPEVTEVMVNGPSSIYVERKGKLETVPASFVDESHVRRIIDKIVGQVGRRIDEATPMVDARLPDGSRVNAVIHPLAVGGPFLTVRKFATDALGVADLIRFGTMTDSVARFFEACVTGRLNIVVAGGTGTGKTTTLNALSSFIPTGDRIVTIEDAKELQLDQEHVLSLEARPPNIEGRGEVSIHDLVRNALRMRPDRIVVGECRSGEALDMLQAMNTGHDGSLTTVHANSPRDALSRIETMTLMAGFDLPVRAIREQMASALDLVIHLSRLRDGSRRVTHVTEVQGIEGDVIVTQDIFLFDFGMGVDAEGRVQGHLKATGLRPKFSEKLADFGITLDEELFQPERFAAARCRITVMRLRAAAGLVAAGVIATVLLVTACPATAADSLVIRKVDATDFPKVVVSVMHTGPDVTAESFALRENGRLVPDLRVVPIGKTATPVGTVLVIDVSGSMRGAKLEAAKAAAREFIARKQPNEQIAVVAFSDTPTIVVNFTGDAGLVTSAVDGLGAHGETALRDAVRVSSGLFTDRRDLQGNLVVLSDGADTVSVSSPEEAIGAATTENVTAFGVGLTGGGEFDSAFLQSLGAATSGGYVATTDPAQLGALYAGVQRQIQNQFELSFDSEVDTPEIEITLVAGGVTATTTAPTGSVASGPAPRVVEPPSVPAPLRADSAKWIVAGLIALAVAAVAIAVATMLRRERAPLDEALSPYFGVTAPPPGEERTERTLAQTALVRRAVDLSTRFASDRGLIELLEKRLEQADLRIRAQEALFFFVAMVVVATVGVLIAFGPLAGLAAVSVLGLGPLALVNFLAARRQRTFSAQLPDTLQLLASSLRAGYSLQQGIETVAREISGPMGRELRRVVIESTLARPLEEALADSAARMASPDFDWAVIAIRIQREVGGNLAELLTTVAQTMIARDRLRREVRALTAEGRFSAIILLALPVVLGGMIFVLNPTYMKPLFGSTLGQVLVAGAAVLAGAGFVWMRKIVEIRV